MIFQEVISKSKIEVSVRNSLAELWRNWKENKFKVELFKNSCIARSKKGKDFLHSKIV